MNSNGLHIFKKVAQWFAGSVTVLILLILILVYTPFFQNFAKDIAIASIKDTTGMDVSINKFRLHFPLNLELQNLTISQYDDTLLSTSEAIVDVAIIPLFHGRVKIDKLNLFDTRYYQGTPDSALYLNTHIDKFVSYDTELSMNVQDILIGENTELDGADIYLAIIDTIESKTDTSQAENLAMNITVPNLKLRNVNLEMKIDPTIDILNTHIGLAELTNGFINLQSQHIAAESLSVDSLTAKYLYPKTIPNTEINKQETTEESTPWDIKIGKIDISIPQAVYAQSGATPKQGFDIDYIEICNSKIQIDSFYNRGIELQVPITELSATERCGLTMHAEGYFGIDSTDMRVEDFHISTPKSSIELEASLGIGDLSLNPSLPLYLLSDAKIAIEDITMALPSVGQLFNAYGPNAELIFDTDISGTTANLDINGINAEITNLLTLTASGQVSNPTHFDKMSGHVAINGKIQNANPLKNQLLDKNTAQTVFTPPMSIDGVIDYNPGRVNGNISLVTATGNLALDADWIQRAESYDMLLNTENLPLQEFMPSLGISDITADIALKGNGYNISKPTTSLLADIDLHQIVYQGKRLENITIDAQIDSCRLIGNISSPNNIANLNAEIVAKITDAEYSWDFSGDISNIDLQALQLSTQPLGGSATLHSDGYYNPQSGDITTSLDISQLNWMLNQNRLTINEAKAQFSASDTLLFASIISDDFNAQVNAPCSIDSLLESIDNTSATITKQIAKRNIDIPQLQQVLPQINLSISSGHNNAISHYLAESYDFNFHDSRISFNNDSLITLQTNFSYMQIGETRLDNVSFNAKQQSHMLAYEVKIDNEPGTMDDFAHVNLNGFLSNNKLSAILKQANINKQQGFLLGLTTSIVDDKLKASFLPQTPIIAYKQWALNSDNFIEIDLNHDHLDANLKLQSDSSSLYIYTEHNSADTTAHGQEDVVMKLKNINLAEWLSISPFAPPVKGNIDADMRFRLGREHVTGNGVLNLNELYYGKERVGTFDLALNLDNDNRKKALRADASLLIDNVKVITASGNVNDSTATNPFLLDFSMIHFPLRVVNPFLPKNVAQLSGMLNGTMNITGNFANPIFNGYLDFDSTAVKVGITGMPYKFSEEKIPVDSNIVCFNNFSIEGLNNNSLFVNGTVDARSFSNITLDLTAKARDMQIVNSSRPKGANIYGKAYIDLDASVKGNMELMRVDAALNLLGGTNVTYVVTDAVQSLTPQSESNMVKFVNLSDTTNIYLDETPQQMPMSMLLNAELTISEGSTINVDLSPDGKNKVSISGSGNLSYSQTPMSIDGRLTGRYTIDNGFINYTPQIVSGGLSMSLMKEKNFKFQEGSYIAFTGDMFNPTLYINAVDQVKANVTQQGQNSRLVNFDIGLSVTNTLQDLDVAFDLSTKDDLTIQNELQSMSPEQRANQAMNMLLYNQYTGPSAKANANLAGNPLYSFLASQLNSWMANNIHGVDISFGIDQYDTTIDGAESTTTSYNYRVSKALFNNRFKIVVGGNYSTDADADENFSQNLINDISFEYMLNRSGTMYVKLFRHVGYESILEGEITQTGVGFVLKRKLNSLRDIFRFGNSSKTKTTPKDEATQTK